MAGLSRTRAFGLVGLLGAWGLVLACGHLPFEDIANSEDAGASPESGNPRDSSVSDGDSGASLDAGRDVTDGGCAGPTCIGTFVSGSIGDDSDPGTAAKPVQTIEKATEIAVALGGKQSVFVAAAHYPEKVTLAEGVDLLGGYDCNATSCTWARDVVKNDTAIQNQDEEGVLAPNTVTRKTLFDGFRVVGKSGFPNGPPGLAAMSLVGGTPTITRCRLAGGDVSGSGFNAKSIGIVILGSSNDAAGALIDRNVITGGTSTVESVGVLFDPKTGTPGSAPVAFVSSNTIRSGAAPFSTAVFARASGASTVLKYNDIAAGASSVAGGSSSAWGITVQSAMTIDANRINTDATTVGTCTQNFSGTYCGGIQSQGSTTTITNNVVLGGKGPRTCAVFLSDGESVNGTVILNANTLDGAGNVGPDGTQSMAIVLHISQGNSATLGKVRNNILLGGTNRNRYGVYEDGIPGKTARPIALDNNDFWFAGTARVDFAYRSWNGTTGTDLAFASLGTIASPTPNANLNVDPLLDLTYHISKTSPVIDQGTATEAPKRDIDDESRPRGVAVDIGADESK